MKPPSVLSGLALAIALAGCAAPTPASTPTPPPTSTATAAPTSTFAPTATASPAPSATPSAPLSQTGPWLVMLADALGAPGTLWAANEDGSGRAPAVDGYVRHFAVRPTRNASGQAEVAYTTSDPGDQRRDITLHILTLPGGSTRVITPLTSAQTSFQPDDLSGPGVSPRLEIAEGLSEGHMAWSPDGQWLAFDAAIDGPSIDVYSYEAATGRVRRLTSGADHALKLVWSQDSRYIVHNSIKCFACADYTASGLWAAKPDGSGVAQLDPPVYMDNLGFIQQIAPDKFVAATYVQGGGSVGRLRIATLSEGSVSYLAPDLDWDTELSTPVIDPDDHVAIVHASAPNDVFTQAGWYLFDTNGRLTPLPALAYNAETQNEVVYDAAARLFVISEPDKLVGVKPDGSLVDAPPYAAFPAPDSSASLMFPRIAGQAGIWVGQGGAAPRQIAPESAPYYQVSWSPDGRSALVNTAASLMLFPAPDFAPVTLVVRAIAPSELREFWDIGWTP